MKKILLAGGCSYTDPNFKSTATQLPDEHRSGWPMWPELMGKSLDLKVINTGQSARDNEWISKTIISNIIKYGDQIDTVAVLWTSVDRIQHYEYTAHPFLDAMNVTGHFTGKLTDWPYTGLNELKWHPDQFKENMVYENWFRDSLLAMYTVAEICESRGINFIFGQGVNFQLYAGAPELCINRVEKLNTDNPKEEYDNILENVNQFGPLDIDIDLIEKGCFDTEKYPIYRELKKKYKKNLMHNGYEIYEFESAFDFRFSQYGGSYRISDTSHWLEGRQPSDMKVYLETYDRTKHDWHPNRQGQKYIADTFISHYKIM